MKLEGTIRKTEGGTQVDFDIRSDSIRAGLMGLMLGLAYPMVFVVFLISVLNNPTNFWVYFWTLVSIPTIYFFAKIYTYSNHAEPNPKILIRRISKILNGVIIEENEVHQ